MSLLGFEPGSMGQKPVFEPLGHESPSAYRKAGQKTLRIVNGIPDQVIHLQ